MKKTVIALFVFVLFYTAQSQVTFKPGVRLGLNIASLSNVDDDARTDFYAGVFGEIRFKGRHALQPEITYSKQGTKNIELTYLGIMITNKFFILDDETPIYLLIAPGIEFNLYGETGDYVSGPGAQQTNLDTDISVSAGVGYEFSFGLGVEARYKKGSADYTSSGYYAGDSRTNSVISLGATYKFDFSK